MAKVESKIVRSPVGFIVSVVSFVVCIIVVFMLAGNIFEGVDADDIACIQSPLSGKLTWYTSAGVKWQGFGKVTKYKKRSIYRFGTSVRFNDGGHGKMHGSIQYEMPTLDMFLTKIHTKFGSQKALENQLVSTVVNKSVYMTGPLMSSKESYAEKRNYLISYVEDQITNGVFRTISKEVKTTDPMTGAEKNITVVEIVQTNGLPARQEESSIKEFEIRTFNFAIDSLPYDAAVENQIKQQQQITMDVQTSMAEAKKAEQRAITVAKNGEADAAKAKWDQEVIKATAVTEAQQQLEVATLNAKSAEQTKREQILLGEGEATRKKLVMQANGALEAKLEAYKEVNATWANAFASFKGNLVPSVVMGGSGGVPTNTNDLVHMLTAKTAMDLGLNMRMEK